MDRLIRQIAGFIYQNLCRDEDYKVAHNSQTLASGIYDLILAAGYVQLAEDQSLPENPYTAEMGDIDYFSSLRLTKRDTHDKAQKDMLKVRVDKDGRKHRFIDCYIEG